MPFTVSHAVVALGVRRLPVPVAAVAVGSMAPDAVLFAPFLPPYDDAHSWWGVVTIDLVVAVVVLLTWWWLVRPAWAPVVPGLRARLPRSWSSPRVLRAGDVLPVLAGCVLGSTTMSSGTASRTAPGSPSARSHPCARPSSPVTHSRSCCRTRRASSGSRRSCSRLAVWWRRTQPRPVEPARPRELMVAVAAVVLVLA